MECPPGKEDINENCLECKRGFYKESNAAAACDRCPDGLTTELPGADAQSLCSVRKFLRLLYIHKQRRLGYLLHGTQQEKTCLWEFENNKGADQPAHLCSLISNFDIPLLEGILSKLASSQFLIF